MPKKDPFIDEYKIESSNKKFQIFPMPLKHWKKIANLLLKLNTEFLFSSFIEVKMEDGMPVRDENNQFVLDDTTFNELNEVLAIALHCESADIIEKYDINIEQAIDILLETLKVNQFKKKMETL